MNSVVVLRDSVRVRARIRVRVRVSVRGLDVHVVRSQGRGSYFTGSEGLSLAIVRHVVAYSMALM